MKFFKSSGFAVSLAFLATASADVIIPVSWKQSNSFNNLRLAGNLSNTVGMSPDGTILYNLDGAPAGELNTANNSQWMTSAKGNLVNAMTAGRVWIVADLGAAYNISSIRLWNWQWNLNGTTSLSGRGINQFDLLVRNSAGDTADGTPGATAINRDNPADDATNALDNDVVFAPGTLNQWQLALENQSLAQAPNNDTYTGQIFSLTGQTARFIAIRVDSHYGNTGGIGLGKVRIEGTAATDTTPPVLASRVPSDDALNVATTGNLVANFSEAILAGTGAITIKRTSDNTVVETFDVASSPRLTFAAAQVTIDPTAPLAPGVEHYVQIAPTAIKDAANNNFPGIVDPDTTSWSFTTDNTPPAVLGFSPASPAKADPGTRLLIQFSEAVEAGPGSVTIRKTSDNSLVETINLAAPGAITTQGRVVAIVRTVSLAPGVEYEVAVPAGAFRDPSGFPAPAITGTSWRFTTNSVTPLVVENFSDAATALNATSADTFSAAITGAATPGVPAWSAGSGFLGNGAVSGSNMAAFLNLGSFINDSKGTAGGKFDLTMTISETNGAWISLGFGSTNTVSLTQNFTTLNGMGTIIYRTQTGTVAALNANGELDMFGGPNNTNAVDGPDGKMGFRTLTATLDLTPAGGYDGATNFGTVFWSDSELGALGNYTYPTTRNFGSILISQGGTTGTINALALYQSGAVGNTFAGWISGFSVGGLTGAAQDPDEDGIGNALENLLGTSPLAFSPGLTAVSHTGSALAFRHTRSATPASDLTGSYEWSANLSTWQGSGVSAGGTTVTFGAPVVVTPGTPELVEVTASVTGNPATRVFVRFKATQN
jgi:Bacterial Ig-like domain